MSRWMTVIIPIAAIVICVCVFRYSRNHHEWEDTAAIAVVIAIVLTTGSMIQGLGSKLESDESFDALNNEHKDILSNQERNYEKLLDIETKIDSNKPSYDYSGETPNDDITDLIVKNRNDVIYKDNIFLLTSKSEKREIRSGRDLFLLMWVT